jgi:hypothetical protein
MLDELRHPREMFGNPLPGKPLPRKQIDFHKQLEYKPLPDKSGKVEI